MKRQAVLTPDKIAKPNRAFGDGFAGMIHFPRRIPQNIKLKIGRRASVALFKRFQTGFHDFTRRCQRIPHTLRVSSGPEFRSDLKARYFAAMTDSAVIVAAFNHRKGIPTIHRRSAYCGNQANSNDENSQSNSHHKLIITTPAGNPSNSGGYILNITNIVCLY